MAKKFAHTAAERNECKGGNTASMQIRDARRKLGDGEVLRSVTVRVGADRLGRVEEKSAGRGRKAEVRSKYTGGCVIS